MKAFLAVAYHWMPGYRAGALLPYFAGVSIFATATHCWFLLLNGNIACSSRVFRFLLAARRKNLPGRQPKYTPLPSDIFRQSCSIFRQIQ